MKKLIFVIALLVGFVCANAQTTINLTADTTGTIAGTAAGTYHLYTSPIITQGYSGYSIDVYVTASGTHATDSTHIEIYASLDGTNYFKLTDLGTPYLVSYGTYQSSVTMASRLSSAGATAGWAWKGTTTLPYRYIQVKVTQYKVASVLTINRCKLHLYK